jgi:outer membrane immunogenic protein
MNKFLSGVVAIAAVSFAGAAYAADIPARMPAKVTPNEVVAYNWGGFYTASTIGGGWDSIDGRSTGGLVHNTDGSKGWTGSVVGIQGQWSNWVLGLEASYSAPFDSKYESSNPGTADCTPVIAGSTCNAKIDRVWTGGAKVGYAFGNWMVYGAGGYAGGRIKENTAFNGVVGSISKENHSGWYAGAGVDYFVTRIWYSDLILGLEYRHIELSDKLHNNDAGPAFNKTFGGDIDMIMAKATFKWVGMGPLTWFVK